MLEHGQNESDQEAGEQRAGFVVHAVTILLLGGSFLASDYDWNASTYENYHAKPDEAEELVAGGRNARKIAYASIALLGAALFVIPGRQRVSFANASLLFVMAYVAVCGFSIAWSDAPWLSIKRFVSLLFALLGLAGLMRHFSARDLIDVALGIGMILLGVSVYAELTHDTFTPLAGEYRFAGVFHPNTQGSYCALMAIAAFFGIKASRRGMLIYAVLLGIAMFFLLLTKSRTALASCVFGLSVAWFLGASRTKQVLTSFGGPFAVCGLLLAALLLGAELASGFETAVQMGRGAQADFVQLNGRVPLWRSLLEHVGERPVLGYGYHGFWTPDRIVEISIEQEWTVPSAHSAFIDVLLSVGFVGAFFLGPGLLIAFWRATSACLRTKSPAHVFVLSVMFFALLTSVFESGFAQPVSFDAFIAACGLFHIALQPSAEKVDSCRRRTRSISPYFSEEPYAGGVV